MFVGRPRVLDALRRHGLTLTDLEGGRRHLPAGALDLRESVDGLAAPAFVLLCVKSGATAAAAAELARALPPGALVVSMQNGLSNTATAQAAAPGLHVRPGMVPYNVAELAPGHYHRGTSGVLAAQDDARLRAWLPRFAQGGAPVLRYRSEPPSADRIFNHSVILTRLSSRLLRSTLSSLRATDKRRAGINCCSTIDKPPARP